MEPISATGEKRNLPQEVGESYENYFNARRFSLFLSLSSLSLFGKCLHARNDSPSNIVHLKLLQ